jgi:hypothetical protein
MFVYHKSINHIGAMVAMCGRGEKLLQISQRIEKSK